MLSLRIIKTHKTFRALYLAHKHFDAQDAGCETILIKAIKDEKVGKLGQKCHKNIIA